MPGDNKVTMSWVEPDDSGSPITGYVIRRGSSAGSLTTRTSPAGTVGAFIDTSAVIGSIYLYTVQAVNAVGAGPQSTAQSAVPALPVVAGTVTAGKVATNAFTNTVSHTVAAVTSMLVVVVSYDTAKAGDTQPSGVTFGGAAMTLVPGSRQISSSTSPQPFHRGTELWYLNAPTARTADVKVTFTGVLVSQSATAVNLTGTGGYSGPSSPPTRRPGRHCPLRPRPPSAGCSLS